MMLGTLTRAGLRVMRVKHSAALTLLVIKAEEVQQAWQKV
jgi:hypothetical protein